MMKSTGLDKLNKGLDDAQKALSELDGDIGAVSFDPQCPESIDAAICDVEKMIDEKVGRYASNPIVGPLVESMKAKYRAGILDRAAEARLEAEDD